MTASENICFKQDTVPDNSAQTADQTRPGFELQTSTPNPKHTPDVLDNMTYTAANLKCITTV